jgi:hypothetical protein
VIKVVRESISPVKGGERIFLKLFWGGHLLFFVRGIIFVFNERILNMAVKEKIKEKRPVGRPSLYRPEYCEAVIKLGKEGCSPAEIASHFDVDRVTLLGWADAHEEFSTALTRAKVHEQAWWERAGKAGMVADKFNAAVWTKSVSARFREDYTEKRDDAPQITIVTNSTVDVRQLGDDARDALRMALLSAGKVIEHEPGER